MTGTNVRTDEERPVERKMTPGYANERPPLYYDEHQQTGVTRSVAMRSAIRSKQATRERESSSRLAGAYQLRKGILLESR